VVRADDAAPTRGDWGQWLRYFRGDTHGTRDMVVLAVTLKPGHAPHPPHRHPEEEFMILAEGTGTWTLDGKEMPARKGDVLYAAPWTLHGIKNTGATPLTYYMVKWSNKGVPAPAKPGDKSPSPQKPEQKDSNTPLPLPGGPSAAQPKAAQGQEDRVKFTTKVKVLDAHTLQFEDGRVAELNGLMDAPDLEQVGLIGDSFYPCGKEAAEFLKKIIGDQKVDCYFLGKRKDGKWGGDLFVGEKSLVVEMVRNGWAVGAHTGMGGWETIAIQNKRGLWRGRFVDPERWRLGERLPEEPLLPGYQVNDPVQLFFTEYRVTGPQVKTPGEGYRLVFTYSTRPVVMVYTWDLNAPVIQLIKKLDEVTKKQKDRRLGSYVVLFCENRAQEKQLNALAEKENIQHTLLALVVVNKWTVRDQKTGPGLQQFLARFGRAAETRVMLATPQRQVKASYAYRKGELNNRQIERIFADLPKILPPSKKDYKPSPNQ
jgi:endonuclease YncB( thermonuclease family)/mannose-6-phosphate isomerase-like protein (cupin superfamily)